MSSPYDEMTRWLKANRTGKETDNEMKNLLVVLQENYKVVMTAWEQLSVETNCEQPTLVAAKQSRLRTINWPRRLEGFKHKQAKACLLEEEAEAKRLAAAEAESEMVRQCTAVIAAKHQAEIEAAKAARKAGASSWGAPKGHSMADKLKSAWASPVPNKGH